MKKTILITILFSVQLFTAQNQDLKRANRFFKKTFYNEAIPIYEKYIKKDSSFLNIKNLADSYYYTSNYVKAQPCYRFLITRFGKNNNEENYFRFSETLKATGNYEEAKAVMRNYFITTNNIKALKEFETETKNLENITDIGERFEIANLPINTINSEFGAIKHGQNLVFSGVTSKVRLFDKEYKWNGERYLNILTIPLKNIIESNPVIINFSEKINTRLHESNAVFTKDGKTVYFTRNNYKKGRRGKDKNKISNLQIYKGQLIDNKWAVISSLPFNSDDYSVEHPALSDDEKTLYFASDMPGTLGSFDIFSVEITPKGYGIPKNLGNKINTPKKEQFPFVSKDNKLYFSSDGHTGCGALDVFVSEIKDNLFSKPLNVGLPVNSGYDDFAFTIDSDSKKGYFSSNRPGGKGKDDIYELLETKPLIIEDCKQFISGIVTDIDTKLPLASTRISLRNSNQIEIQNSITSSDGKFNFTVPCETNYIIVANKAEYTNDTKSLQIDKERKKNNKITMVFKSFLAIKNEEKEKRKAELARLEKQQKDKEIAAKKQIELANRKKKERENTLVTKEKDVIKTKNQLMIKTDPIYFDYNLWYIRKESRVILNRVAELMKKYPEITIEIGSYTDNRGNKKYNFDLSSKRAHSTKEYLIKQQGISEKRIIAKGYGEMFPIIKCEPSESCNEEQHELNRRNEFIIKEW